MLLYIIFLIYFLLKNSVLVGQRVLFWLESEYCFSWTVSIIFILALMNTK